jgi:hypothetical protein
MLAALDAPWDLAPAAAPRARRRAWPVAAAALALGLASVAVAAMRARPAADGA